MGLSRRQFILGAAGAGLVLLSNPLPRIIPAWGSSLAFGATAATKYVSNRTSTGGNGTLANPYAASEIWDNMVAGDEFVFLNGIYQGTNCMIDSLSYGGGGKDGTAEAFITIRAETDGKVTINGQFDRAPIRLANNNYFIIQGFNACNAQGSAVVNLTNTGGTCNWIQLKRLCAWDVTISENRHVFSLNYGSNFLVEDCAGWGGGRKIFELFKGGSGTSGGYGSGGATMRRCFGEWNRYGTTNWGPIHTFLLSYWYTNVIAENLIGTANMDSGYTANNPYDIIGVSGGDADGTSRYVKLYGSLAYLRQNQVMPFPTLIWSNGVYGQIDLRDNAACIQSGTNHTDSTPILCSGAQLPNQSISNSYSINNGTPSRVQSGWSNTNFSEGGFRVIPLPPKYVDGVKLAGQTPFPWPMNQRIIDARIQSGRTPIDVTATVQQVCGGGGSNTNDPPQAPINLKVF